MTLRRKDSLFQGFAVLMKRDQIQVAGECPYSANTNRLDRHWVPWLTMCAGIATGQSHGTPFMVR
jgi:hypothetical protein